MNKADETVYLGRIISLLGKHQQLTLGEIKNKTRHFLRKRHQTDSSLFNTLELFVTQGVLTRKVYKSRIYYAIEPTAMGATKPVAKKLDLVEHGAETGTELFNQMVTRAKNYKPLATATTTEPAITTTETKEDLEDYLKDA